MNFDEIIFEWLDSVMFMVFSQWKSNNRLEMSAWPLPSQ